MLVSGVIFMREYLHLQGMLQQDARALRLFLSMPERARQAAWESAARINSEEKLLALRRLYEQA